MERERARPFTAEDLGFAELEAAPAEPAGRGGLWRKRVGERDYLFRSVRDLDPLAEVERLQRAVFAGIADVDVAGPGLLVSVPETGGEVIGAYRSGPAGEELVGFVIGWGGFVGGRPRLLSDMLGVRADVRGGGLGAELKKLQAALARSRGFLEVVWTVDPLRAANARLNFEKLGAFADRYEVDRYGGFAPGLYGGLPTDRLHVTWPLDSPRVRERLLGRTRPRTQEDVAGLPLFDPSDGERPVQALTPIPAEIDRLLAADPEAALAWRLRVRETLTWAIAAGYAVVGFAGETGTAETAALLLERRDAGR